MLQYGRLSSDCNLESIKSLQIHLQQHNVVVLKDSGGSVALPVESCESSITVDMSTMQTKPERRSDTRDYSTDLVGHRQFNIGHSRCCYCYCHCCLDDDVDHASDLCHSPLDAQPPSVSVHTSHTLTLYS